MTDDTDRKWNFTEKCSSQKHRDDGQSKHEILNDDPPRGLRESDPVGEAG